MAGLRVRTVTAAALTAVTGVFLLLVPAAPALAHNSLTGSSPRDGARLARPPASVRLTFLARLRPASTKVTITGPDGASAVAGAPAFSGSRVTVPFRAGPAGRYQVAYELPSDDGHPIRGKVRFTLTVGAGPATALPTTPAAAPTTSAAAAPTPPATPVDQDLASDEDAGPPWWSWALAALTVVLLAAGGFALARRRA
jgi:methionine-rich copper-binding protein CopC